MAMTSRERLTRIFRGQIPDRPAVKLWGFVKGQAMLHPDYEPVYQLGLELADHIGSANSPFDIYGGIYGGDLWRRWEEPSESDKWVIVRTELKTSQGVLTCARKDSTVGLPSYDIEPLLKQPKDIKILLSAPYEPFPFTTKPFEAAEASIGERGIVDYGLPHAMYALQGAAGSINFALWSMECRDLLSEAIEVYAKRLYDHVKCALEAGLKPVFAWIGPELCIPPLMGIKDFDDFVYAFDKPLCDLIHNGGGRVWVHCHGKMGPVLSRFMEMGVDVLNPMEPPPMGDITLSDAFAQVGNRMGLEGGIESHDLMTASDERMTHLIHEAIDAGQGNRFILCPSSGYMEWPNPTARYIANLKTFVAEGVRYAEQGRVVPTSKRSL